uniref:CD160 molecule n=1 Tax=Suricata suricatta TaxID=37032 RepID=A0A673TYH1_SURSU
TLMAPGRGCLVLAILLPIVCIPPGGCMHIFSSFHEEGKQLHLICNLRHLKEEAEGVTVFLCKNRSLDCSPETSLIKRPSQLVFTLNRTTSDSGTYQCCARSQKPDIHLRGRFFSVLVTETGRYTVTGLKHTEHPTFTHSQGTPGSGFLQKVWLMLVTSMLALRGVFRRALSTCNEAATPLTSRLSPRTWVEG